MKLTLEAIEKQIAYWESARNVWRKYEQPGTTDFNTFVYITYLHTGNVTETTRIINDSGFRTIGKSKKPTKYIPTDISNIIRETDIADRELQTICRDLIENNSIIAGMIH